MTIYKQVGQLVIKTIVACAVSVHGTIIIDYSNKGMAKVYGRVELGIDSKRRDLQYKQTNKQTKERTNEKAMNLHN